MQGYWCLFLTFALIYSVCQKLFEILLIIVPNSVQTFLEPGNKTNIPAVYKHIACILYESTAFDQTLFKC